MSGGDALLISIPAPMVAGKPAWLLMNDRKNWRAKAPITKAWREAACAVARPESSRSFEGVHIIVRAHRTGRAIDADAVASTAKACIDGLVDAGVLVDDSPKYVHAVTYLTAPKSDGDSLEITVAQCESHCDYHL